MLDSTDPAQIAAFEARVDLARTLVVVSSKSGGTLEPNILKAYFWERMRAAVGAERAGRHFVAVTDPGSKVQAMAERDGFRRVFLGDPAIGGRYSVLSNFGLVPAAAMGLDLRRFLEAAALMVRACGPGVPPAQNPGVRLGAVLGALGRRGRDKVTIVASPGIADLGAWLEQLIAESTGKQGKGLVPVDGEAPAPPDRYGRRPRSSPICASATRPTRRRTQPSRRWRGRPAGRARRAGRPLAARAGLLPWEMATAVAGAILGINPFDQPDVEASKAKTRELTGAYAESGRLPAEEPALTEDGLSVFGDGVDGGGHRTRRSARTSAGSAPGTTSRCWPMSSGTGRTGSACSGCGRRCATGGASPPSPSSGRASSIRRARPTRAARTAACFCRSRPSPPRDLPVPGERYSFGVVEAAQARGDLGVLAERGRRALRVHLGADVAAGLRRLEAAIERALA